MTSQSSFDFQYFVVPLVEKVFPRRRNSHAHRLNLHLYKSHVHFSKITEKFIAENHILRVPQPSSSLDLAPSDFWIFVHLKNALIIRTLDDPEELAESIIPFSGEVQPLGTSGQMDLGEQWRLLSRINQLSAEPSLRSLSQGLMPLLIDFPRLTFNENSDNMINSSSDSLNKSRRT
jgi:hypothetical protein